MLLNSNKKYFLWIQERNWCYYKWHCKKSNLHVIIEFARVISLAQVWKNIEKPNKPIHIFTAQTFRGVFHLPFYYKRKWLIDLTNDTQISLFGNDLRWLCFSVLEKYLEIRTCNRIKYMHMSIYSTISSNKNIWTFSHKISVNSSQLSSPSASVSLTKSSWIFFSAVVCFNTNMKNDITPIIINSKNYCVNNRNRLDTFIPPKIN